MRAIAILIIILLPALVQAQYITDTLGLTKVVFDAIEDGVKAPMDTVIAEKYDYYSSQLGEDPYFFALKTTCLFMQALREGDEAKAKAMVLGMVADTLIHSNGMNFRDSYLEDQYSNARNNAKFIGFPLVFKRVEPARNQEYPDGKTWKVIFEAPLNQGPVTFWTEVFIPARVLENGEMDVRIANLNGFGSFRLKGR